MFNPQIWIALALAFITWGGVMFGTGFHYGERNTVAQSKYDGVVKQLVFEQARINSATDQHDRDAKALAAKGTVATADIATKEKEIDDAQKRQAALAKANMVLNANLATARLMLGDATADKERAIASAATAASQRTTESTNLAGRLDSCKQAYTGLVTSARVNNAELKRAIVRRDTCVKLYEDAAQTLNGD